MDIELLKTFLEVYRTRHFGRASERMFLTQSAVSARIRLLEETLGVALFTRKRNDIQLTPAGARLLKHAETIVSGWERARQDTALEPEYTRSLAIGGVVDLWDILLQGWLRMVHQQMPELALSGEAHASEALLRRLLDGVLDLAFMFEPPQMPDLTVRQVATINLLLVSTRTDQLPVDAITRDYVMVDWGSSFAQSHSRHFASMPAPAVRIGLGSIALRFILANGGAAYLAEPTVSAHLERGGLFAVAGAPQIERFAYAVYHPGTEQEPVIRQALSYMG